MPELLAPAGDFEKMKFAYLYGADAIYCGGQNFSLRANAKNFSLEELKEVKPFPIMDLFKMSNNYKVLFANYFSDFKKVVCNSTDSFTKALELDAKLDELYNSPEYEVFKNNI